MSKVIAYHFWSPTCAPCRVIKPAIEDLKEEFSQVQWVSVNTHDDRDNYSMKFSVHVVPTIVIVAKDETGKEVYSDKSSGTTMMNYYRMIRNGLRLARMTQS